MKKLKRYAGILVGSTAAVLTACGGSSAVKPVEEVKESVAVEVAPQVTPPKAEEKPAPKPEPKVQAKPVEVTPPPVVVESKPAPEVKPEPKPASRASTSTPKLDAPNPTANRIGSEKELKQKVSYARMMFMSKSSKRVAASDNAEAKAMLDDSKSKMEQAKSALDAGDLATAQGLIDDSMRLFNAASIMVPSEAVIAEQRKRYEDLLKELEQSKATHQENYDRMVKKEGKEAGVEYDAEQVDILVVEAGKLAAEKDYDSAAATVDSANRMVNEAITTMLKDQIITYELNIDTPEGEWAYELDRYLGYEELIPIAIENKKPNKGQLFLINRSVDKAKGMADIARETAAAGEYPKAIAQVMDATKEVRKALRLMGVKQ